MLGTTTIIAEFTSPTKKLAHQIKANPCRSRGLISLLLIIWSWLWYSRREVMPNSSRVTFDTAYMYIVRCMCKVKRSEQRSGRKGRGSKENVQR